ncbi:MAG: hypothetical protein ACFE0Q_06040 [Anaerolineae bacterium]
MVILNEPPIEEKAKADQLKFPLDPIHGGLRVAVFGSFVGAGVLGFVGGITLLPNLGFVAVLIAIASATGTSMGVEHALKDRWSSGREVVADSERIALTKDSKIETVINPQQQVNVLTWRFEVKKDGPRAKKGWYLLALGLEQDDSYIVIYTAVDPKMFETMPLAQHFKVLEKPNAEKKSKLPASSSGMRMAGEQKRLYEGEVIRQLVGGDMLFEQFVETIDFLQTHYPKWMLTD